MNRKRITLVWGILCAALVSAEPRIMYEEDPSLLITNVRVVIQSGAASDPMDRAGLSNLMAELMLRGTKKRTRTKLQSEIEKMGAALAATTSHDHIVFHGTVIRENTTAFLALLEDVLLHPAFPKTEFQSLKEENLAELAHTKNQNNRLGGLVIRRAAYAGSPLARPTSGSLSTVRSIQLDDVMRAYNNAFHRGNVVFGVAAPLKEAEMSQALGKIWQQLPDGARHSVKSVSPKSPERPTLFVIHKPNTSTGSLIFGQAGITAKDKERYSLGLGNFSFGGEPLVSRLFRTVRGELGWTYSIFSSYTAMGNLSGQQGMYVIVSTPSVEHSVKTMLKVQEMWSSFLDKGLSSDELRLAHDSVVNSYPFQFDSAQKRVSEKLESYLYDVPLLSPEEFAKTIGKIGNSDIKKALATKQSPSGWWMAIVADKDVISKQLEEAQKDIPAEKRLVIQKVYSPEEVIQ